MVIYCAKNKFRKVIEINLKSTEFELQATLYSFLKQHFPAIKGEVTVKTEDEGTKNPRLDIVVFSKEMEILFAVEVKRPSRKKDGKSVEQLKKTQEYKEILDCPVYGIRKYSEITPLIKRLKDEFPEQTTF